MACPLTTQIIPLPAGHRFSESVQSFGQRSLADACFVQALAVQALAAIPDDAANWA
jgi:hypothetical protein